MLNKTEFPADAILDAAKALDPTCFARAVGKARRRSEENVVAVSIKAGDLNRIVFHGTATGRTVEMAIGDFFSSGLAVTQCLIEGGPEVLTIAPEAQSVCKGLKRAMPVANPS